MKLYFLEVEGWRQYKDRQRIDFASGDQSLTLIHGENSGGKTALLNALLWCISEELTPKLDLSQPLWWEIDGAFVERCSVRVEFEHEGDDYLAIRTLVRDKNWRPRGKFGKSDFKLFVYRDNDLRPVDVTPELVMDRILPRGMARYFFFDGEGFKAGASDSLTFRKSIKTMLGFDFAEDAVKHLEDLKKLKTKERDEKKRELLASADDRENYDKAVSARDRLQSEFEEKIEARKKNEEHRALAAKKIKELDDPEAKHAQRQIDQLDRELSQIEKDRTEFASRQKSLIGRHSLALFGAALFDKGIEIVDAAREKGKIPADYSDTFINDLLADGKCICDRHLGDIEASKLRALISTATTRVIEKRLTKAQVGAKRDQADAARQFSQDYAQIITKLAELDNRARQARDLREEWITKQRDIDEAELNKWIDIRDKAEKGIQLADREFGRYEALLDEANRTVAQFSGKGERFDNAAQNRIDVLNRQIKKYSSLIALANSTLAEQLQQTAVELARSINLTLRKHAGASHTAKVTKDYEYFLVDNEGQPVATGGGMGLLLNLTFISELVRLAKRRINENAGGLLVPGTIAPLTIDAPFGEMDTVYQPAAAEILLSASDQLTLMLSTSHWLPVDETIKKHVGKEFLIYLNDPHKRSGEETNPITIGGKTYMQRKYDSSMPSVSWIEEIEHG